VSRTAPALVAALALAGCGSTGNDEEAADLLERGFSTDVRSGVVSMDAELELEGVDQFDEPLRLELEGPVGSVSPTRMPDLDMEFRASGLGQSYEGRVVLTRRNAWVILGDETYEVGEEAWGNVLETLESAEEGPTTFAEAGADPLGWVEDAETDGNEQVGGVSTAKVTGRLDVEDILRDLNKFIAEPDERIPTDAINELSEYLGDVDFEAWVGRDGIWRRVTSEVEFEVPEEQRDRVGGLEGGRMEVEMELDDPNEPVEIEGPAHGRPIDELLRELGIPPELLLGPGFAQPAPG
jgi:hypothetical protein